MHSILEEIFIFAHRDSEAFLSTKLYGNFPDNQNQMVRFDYPD